MNRLNCTVGGAGQREVFALLLTPSRPHRSASSEQSLKGNLRGTLTLEPATTTAHRGGRQRFSSACGSLEPAAKVPHRLQPALTIEAQPVQDRRKPARNRPATFRTQLAPRPVQQRQVLLKLDRQIASIRCPRRKLRPRRTRACLRFAVVCGDNPRRDLLRQRSHIRQLARTLVERQLAKPSVRSLCLSGRNVLDRVFQRRLFKRRRGVSCRIGKTRRQRPDWLLITA